MKYTGILLAIMFVAYVSSVGCKCRREEDKGMTLKLELDSMQSALNLIGSNRTPSQPSRYTYVKYIGSVQCTECVIKGLRHWVAFQELFDQHPDCLSLIIVIAPQKYQRETLCEELAKDTIMLDCIYIDNLGAFERANPHLPQDPFTNCFLIDENGRVLLQGDPTSNEDVERQFVELVEKTFAQEERE